MSELTTPPAAVDASPWSVFADTLGDAIAEPEEGTPPPAEGTPAAPAAGEAAPAIPPAAAAPAADGQARDDQGRFTPAAATDPEAVPAWDGQEAAGRSFKELRTAKTQAEVDAAYWRNVAEGRIPNPNAAAQPAQVAQPAAKADDDPEPDPANYTDDAAYWRDIRAWDRRQTVAEARKEFEPVKQAQEAERIGNNFAAAQREVGEDSWKRYWAALDALSNEVPGVVDKVFRSANPGKEVIKLGRQLTGEVATAAPAAAAPATPPAAVPAVAPIPLKADGTPDMAALAANPQFQEAVLRAMAANNAAAGTPPPTLPTGPRGLGPSGGSGTVDPDGVLTPEAIRAIKDPEKLRGVSGSVFGQFLK